MRQLPMEILIALDEQEYTTQRDLAERVGYSLGAVNKELAKLHKDGWLADNKLSAQAKELLDQNHNHQAIILAAGPGLRMIPIHSDQPKAMLEINGERLIERMIRQLQETGIKDIQVVVGFQKEKFEYLMDDFGVRLVVNPEYHLKNDYSSLGRAHKYFKEDTAGSYVIPADLYFKENPFRSAELYSWMSTEPATRSADSVRQDKAGQLVPEKLENSKIKLLGLSYLNQEALAYFKEHFQAHKDDSAFEEASWEESFFVSSKKVNAKRPIIFGREIPAENYLEINTFEDLREADPHSSALESPILTKLAGVFGIEESEISNIEQVKAGMTNRSFFFNVGDERYIMRIPGEGTDKLINRFEEADVYRALDGKGLTDDVIFIEPETGYKITRYIDNSRGVDLESIEDIERAMDKLREFHSMELEVDHDFDIWRLTNYYEELWEGKESIYPDYKKTKAHMEEIFAYLEHARTKRILCHIDSVAENFLIYTPEGSDEVDIRLIDWEYSGMQDPAVDVAMFCIYALYDREEVDRLIDIYYQGKTTKEQRALVYAYIAVAGLLWSNWCEFKSHLGIEFGEYSLRQYRYAKDYYKILKEEMNVL